MNKSIAIEFARWLATDQPELFVALFKRAKQASGELAGIADIFSTIGTSLGNAASAVGSYLTTPGGMNAITQLGSAYLQSRAARQSVQLNLDRARAGQSPEPIQTAYNPATGQFEVVDMNSGAQVLPGARSNITALPMLESRWLPFAIAGGVLVLGLFFLSRSRR